MATTPSFSGTNFTPKTFWKRPEGKPGMILTAALAAAVIYGLYLALPILLAVTWGLVNLTIGVGILAAIGYVVTNGTVQTLAKNIFQSVCRGIATFYTTIDPIGILKNNLDDMRKAKAQLDQTIQRFAGSDSNLRAKISQMNSEINQLGMKAETAGRMLPTKTDPLERERIQLQQGTYLQKAGMLMDSKKQLEALETQTSDMLTKFRHWSQVSDAKIDRTAMKVDILSDQRKMILEAKSTLNVGQRLLRGDPEQLKLVDGAIEYLAEDAARTVGEIQEFNRYSDKLLTDIDIENGAQAEEARKKFAELGVKIDESTNRPSAVDLMSSTINSAVNSPAFNPNPMGKSASASGGGSDFNDLFK